MIVMLIGAVIVGLILVYAACRLSSIIGEGDDW